MQYPTTYAHHQFINEQSHAMILQFLFFQYIPYRKAGKEGKTYEKGSKKEVKHE
jgi:hypothetical protein